MLRLLWRGLLPAVCVLAGLPHALGQFNIVPIPAGNIYLRSQLWSLSVSNTGTSTVTGRIHLEMKDMQSRQTVLSATSGPFTVAPGVHAWQEQALEPIIYTYTSAGVTDRGAGGMLPIGQYQVCYQLLATYGENQQAAADECDEIAVEPLSPPALTLPENDSAVHTATPNFTWVPPGPAAMFADLNYDLLISELHQGQSITDAIQKNLPVQQAEGLGQPFFTFPLQGPQLEPGKSYVWQVVAKDGQRYGAKSEVWTFRMPDSLHASVNNNVVYLLMGGRSNALNLNGQTMLHVKYVSYASVYTAAIELQDERGGLIYTVQRMIRQGDNYLDLPLSRQLQSKHAYTVIIPGSSGAPTSMTFTIL